MRLAGLRGRSASVAGFLRRCGFLQLSKTAPSRGRTERSLPWMFCARHRAFRARECRGLTIKSFLCHFVCSRSPIHHASSGTAWSLWVAADARAERIAQSHAEPSLGRGLRHTVPTLEDRVVFRTSTVVGWSLIEISLVCIRDSMLLLSRQLALIAILHRLLSFCFCAFHSP